MKRLTDLINNVSIIEKINFLDYQIYGITYNSLMVKDNFIFCAIRGTATDGNIFISQAIEKGAKVVLTEVAPVNPIEGITYLIVENVRKSMALIANKFYDYDKNISKIIAVTGTNGKTTITFLISSLLRGLGYRTAIIGTTGIFIDDDVLPSTHTTPESVHLYELIHSINSRGVDYIVMEVSSHSLAQHRVYGIDVEVAIFTNLSPDHLDYHKTMDNYAAAKKILFDSLKHKSFAVVNADDHYADFIASSLQNEQIIRVGQNTHSDFIIDVPSSSITGINFNLLLKNSGLKININSKLIGDFNIYNLALSLAALSCLGFDINQLSNLTSTIEGAPGRMEFIQLKTGAVGVVDYAHTPDALEKAIKTLKSLNQGGKIITVFGCGGDRDKSKRPLMGKIASVLSDLVIITNDNPRSEDPNVILNEIVQGIDNSFIHKISIIPNRSEAIEKAVNISKTTDIILVAGKGHEKYQIFGNEKIYFDDKEELKKYLQ